MTRPRTPVLVAAAALLAAVAAAGCSAEVSVGGNLDIAKLEKTLTAELEKSTGTEVTSIDCPDKVRSDRGTTFACTFQGESGISGAVDVDVTDDDGNVHYQTDATSLTFAGDKLADAIASDFATTYPDQADVLESVDCGESVTATPGSSATCTVTSTDGQSADLTVTIDEQGAANWNFSEITG